MSSQFVSGLRYAARGCILPVFRNPHNTSRTRFIPTQSMRRNAAGPQTFFSARVSAAEKSEFKALLPIHGGQTACFAIALEKLLDLAEHAEDIRRFIHEDIQRHLHEETRGEPTEELTIQINTNLYLRFNELVPEQGGTSWFIRRTLHALNSQLSSFVLDERIELAVRSILLPRQGNGTENQ